MSIGSSVSGGVEDVLYVNNTMSETRGQWGQGIHIKTRIGIGGYIKNVIWDSNIFYSTGLAGECIARVCSREHCYIFVMLSLTLSISVLFALRSYTH